MLPAIIIPFSRSACQSNAPVILAVPAGRLLARLINGYSATPKALRHNPFQRTSSSISSLRTRMQFDDDPFERLAPVLQSGGRLPWPKRAAHSETSGRWINFPSECCLGLLSQANPPETHENEVDAMEKWISRWECPVWG